MTHHLLAGRLVCACALLIALIHGEKLAAQAQPLPLGSHTGGVAVARFSPDGQLVVTGSFDRTLQVHNAADGKLLRTLSGHTGQVLSLAITPDSRRIFSGGRDNTLQVWDLYLPTPVAQLAGHAAAVQAIAVSHDDAWAATGAADRSLKLFSRVDGKLLFELPGHTAAIERLAVKVDNTQLAAGDASGVVRLWNPTDGTALGVLGAHSGPIVGLAYHPTASTIMTAGGEGTVKIWSLPLAPPKLLPDAADAVTTTAISADGTIVFAGGADASLRSFNAATGAAVRTFAGQAGAVNSLALSVDATLIATGNATGEIRLWNAADGAAAGTMLGHAGKIASLAISAQKTHVASAGDDGTVRLWRLTPATMPLAGHTLPISSTAVSVDGKMIATGAADKSVRLYNAADGTFVRALAAHSDAVTALHFSADNTQLVSGDALGEVRVSTVADGALQAALLAHNAAATATATAPDGKLLYTAGADGTWKTWQLPLTAARPLLTTTDAAAKLALASDGKQLVVGSADGKLNIVDPTASQPAKELVGQVGAPTALAIAGGLIAAGNAEGEIRLWNGADGADRLTLLGHTGSVRDVAISPKGDLIASAGADGTLRLWKPPVATKVLPGGEMTVEVAALTGDRTLIALGGVAGGTQSIVVRNVASGAVIATLLGHEGPLTAVAFSADKTKLISGSADKTARVWNLADPKFPEIAKFVGHTAAISAVAFSADGAQAYSAAADNSLKQWNVADAVEVRTLAGHTQPVSALAVAGPTLYSASADGSVRGWKTADGAPAGNFPAGAAATSLTVSVDGAALAVGLADKSIKLLSSVDGKLLATLNGTTAAPSSVAISADGQRIASAAADGIRVWNASGALLERFPASAAASKSVAFTPDGAALVAVDAKNVLQLLTPSLVQIVAAKSEFTSVAFLPDALALLVGAADGAIGQFAAADLKPMRTFAGGAAAVVDIDVSADGKQLAVSSADNALRIWDLASITPAPAISPTKILPLSAPPANISFTASGNRLATVGGDIFVRVWDTATLTELQRLTPHTAAAQAVALSADGTTIYSASSDKTVVASAVNVLRAVAPADPKIGIADAALASDGKLFVAAAGLAVKLWDAATGVLLQEVPAGEKPLSAVALRGDGQQLAAGGGDLYLFLWQLTPQGPGALTKIPVPSAIKRLRYDATSTRIAAACDDGQLRVFAAADGRLLEVVAASPPVDGQAVSAPTCVAFASDGQSLVTAAGPQGFVRPLSLVRLLTGHEGGATGALFSADGTKLITSGVDKTVRMWNATDGAPLTTFAGVADAVTSLALSTSGTLLVAACADKSLLGWDVPAAPAAQPIAAKFSLPQPALVQRVSISADGARVATSDVDGTVRVFDVALARELERFTGHTGAALAVALSGDGKTLVSGGSDKTARIWTISAQQMFIADPAKLIDAALTPDGAQFVSAGAADMSVKVWDATGKQVRACAPAAAALGRIAVRSDGAQIAGCDAQGRLLLWNAADGVLASTTETGGPIQQLSYSRDGKQLAVAGSAQLRVYDPTAAQPVLLQENASATPLLSACFAANGREIMTGADKLVSVWAYASPTATASIAGHQGPIYSVAISPDGALAATASGDQSIRLWNAVTREPVRQFAGHVGAVYSVHFSSDGKQLVSAGADGTARLWDVAAGTELKKLAIELKEGERVAACYDVALAANGQSLATAGADGLVRAWNVASGQAAAPLKGHTDAIYRVAYNQAATRLMTCGHAGSVNVWDAAAGQPLFTSKLPAVAYYAALSADGSRIVAACADGKAYVVEVPQNAR